MNENNRIVSLDFLRAAAAYLVAIPHFFIYTSISKANIFENISVSAVEIFFVLSGYVLAPQLLLVLNGTQNALRIFLIRRWMRTIPAYFLALLLVSVIFKKFFSGDFFRYLFYIQNLFHQYNHVDYFSVAWSLSVEEWFYVIFPVFMLICAKLTNKQSVNFYIFFALIFITIITIIRLNTVVDVHSWGDSIRRVVVFRIDSIAYGFLLFLFMKQLDKRPSIIFSWLGLVLSFTGILYLLHIIKYPFAQVIYPFSAASLGAFAIMACLSLEDNIKNETLQQMSQVVGQTSYGVYLFHMPVMYMVSIILATSSLSIRFIAFVIGTSVLAAVSNYFLEQPILQLRPKYNRIRDVKLHDKQNIILHGNEQT